MIMSEDIEKRIDMPNANDSLPKVEGKKKIKLENGAEKTLSTIATIVLVCGIIATVISLCTIVWIQNPSYTYIEDKIFSPSGFITTITILFSSLISWSLLKVIANISLTLKDINNKLNK